jgi:RNA polymerase sigma-70 factor (ECF subfamily)
MNPGHAVLLNIHAVEQAPPSADELVFAAQAGSAEAFTALYGIYSRRIYKTIIAITKNPEDAEDALQETFLRAYVAVRTFEGRSHIYSWLTRIAINTSLMTLRRRRTCREILFDPDTEPDSEGTGLTVRDTAPNPEEVSNRRELQLKVLHAIHRLNPSLREPIRLLMTQGLSVKEIGRALDLSDAAVKSRLHRARRRLSAVCNGKRISHPMA